MTSLQKRDFCTGICIFTAAFVVRVTAVWMSGADRLFFAKYILLGDELRENGFVATRPFSYSPLYCYFMAFARSIASDSVFGTLVLQAFLGGITCVSIFLVARSLMKFKTAVFCACVACLYGSFVLYDINLLSDSMGLSLHFSMLAMLCRERPSPTMRWGFPVVVGLSVLQRPNNLLLVPFFLFLWGWKDANWRKRAQTCALFLGMLVLTLSPVMYQNFVLTGEVGLSASNPGYIFYSANNCYCVGFRYHPPPVLVSAEMSGASERSPIDAMDAQLAAYVSSQIAGQTMSLSQSSSFYLKETFQYFQHYPREAIELFLKKIWMSFHGTNPHDTLPVYVHSPWVRRIAPIAYWMILPFGLMGLFLSFKRFKTWIPLYVLLGSQAGMMVIFYVIVRFRLSVEGTMILFSGLALEWAGSLFQKRAWFRLGLLGVAISLFACLSTFLPADLREVALESEGNAYLMQSRIANEKPEMQEAISRLEKMAAQVPPGLRMAELLYRRLGEMYQKTGEIELARRAQERAILSEKLRNARWKTHKDEISWKECLRLSHSSWANRRPEQALEMVRKAIEKKPSAPESWYYLAFFQRMEGKKESLESLRVALRNGLLFTHLGLQGSFALAEEYLARGEMEKARFFFSQAARQAKFVPWFPPEPENESIIDRLKALGFLSPTEKF